MYHYKALNGDAYTGLLTTRQHPRITGRTEVRACIFSPRVLVSWLDCPMLLSLILVLYFLSESQDLWCRNIPGTASTLKRRLWEAPSNRWVKTRRQWVKSVYPFPSSKVHTVLPCHPNSSRTTSSCQSSRMCSSDGRHHTHPLTHFSTRPQRHWISTFAQTVSLSW